MQAALNASTAKPSRQAETFRKTIRPSGLLDGSFQTTRLFAMA